MVPPARARGHQALSQWLAGPSPTQQMVTVGLGHSLPVVLNFKGLLGDHY